MTRLTLEQAQRAWERVLQLVTTWEDAVKFLEEWDIVCQNDAK